MKILSLLLVSLALSSFARAKSPAPLPEPPVEERLKLWLSKQQAVQWKLSAVVARSHAAAPAEASSDLKDAVADPVAAPGAQEIAGAPEQQRRALMGKLPGMAVQPFSGCRALESCPEAPASFRIDEDHQIQDAVVGLLRPWILLQTARGRGLSYEAVDSSGDRLMNVKLEGLPEAGLSVIVTPLPYGGYEVRLIGSSDISELYRRERETVLSSRAGSA